jgi:phage tail sheath protein FI
MAFQLSPGVNVSEIDLTTVVPSVSTTAGAFAGDFAWGPAGKVKLVTHETELVSFFGEPSANAQQGNTATSFFTAASFLAYGNNLQVVRAVSSNSKNAAANTGNALGLANTAVGYQLKNEDSYDNIVINDTATLNTAMFLARYPGDIGNSLKVSTCVANTAAFTGWTYNTFFSAAPSTSAYATKVNGANDQIHMVVIDEDGLLSGERNTVLETFGFLSLASDAAYDDGSSAFISNVIRSKSKYLYIGNTSLFSANAGRVAANTNFMPTSNTIQNYSLGGGTYETASDANLISSVDLFGNADEIDVSLFVSGDVSTTVQQRIINTAISRKDCVAFVSPPKSTVVNNSGSEVGSIASWFTSLGIATSYAVADSGWKYMFDKYNNTYRWIPLNGDIAGLCVRTDETRDPWFSPAGYSRGGIKNVVKLAWNPNKTQRDYLYQSAVNPVISVPGQGTLLFGDKTLTLQPSAFNRINVRRLFIVLEKAIANASKYSLFELNDEFTRSQFVGLIEPFLRDIKGRRGIYDYRVVCDDTNNTAQVIDNNQFVGDIYIKPARSINFIQLNFVAVRTGVNFSEIVGGV